MKKAHKLCLFLLTAFLLNACRKEATVTLDQQKNVSNISPEKRQIVQECKEWYLRKEVESRKLASVNGKLSDDSGDFVGNPDWDKPGFYQLSPKIPEFNRFPLTGYEVNRSFTNRMNPKGFRDIMFRKYGEDDFRVDIMEVHPDSEYLKRKRLEKGLDENTDMRQMIDNEDFTGYFLIFSPVNGLRYGERRENGVITHQLEIPGNN